MDVESECKKVIEIQYLYFFRMIFQKWKNIKIIVNV